MNVALVSRVQMNPYVGLLAEGLRQAAPDVQVIMLDDLSLRWVWRERDETDVLHLHWAELLFASATWKGAFLRWLRFAAALVLARLCGVVIVYTVHNIEHHEGSHALLNRWANALLFRWAAVVHVHEEATRQEVAARFGRRRGVVLIPHGNYLSYPNACSREEARSRLGLPAEAFVYLTLGQVRPYKGIEELVRAFTRLSDAEARLVIAGNVHDPEYGRRIQEMAASDPRIVLHFGYVPPEEVQYYMNASDICVLPYRHVTTSGAAILAFSFGKPVIAPRLGGFPQLVQDRRGLLYDANDVEGLLGALRRAREADLVQAGKEAWLLARELDWTRLARLHLQAYRQALEATRRGEEGAVRRWSGGVKHDRG